MIWHFHQWRDLGVEIISTCSVLHSVLPPWDWQPDFIMEGLEDFPTAQKFLLAIFKNRWYKLFIYVVGYLAINMRSTVWRKSISMSSQFQKLQPGKL